MAAQERLSAAQRSKVRRLSAPKELAPDEEGGELNIVPFLDIIMNVLMFVLATIAVTFTTVDTFPPRAGGGRAPTTPSLGLTVILVPDGFSIKAAGGNVASGCSGIGSGVAIPMHEVINDKGQHVKDYDFDALHACVRKLKGENPAFEDETAATISANPNVRLASITGTMDAIRKLEPSDPEWTQRGCVEAPPAGAVDKCHCAPDDKTKAWEGKGCILPDITFGLAR